MDHTLQVYRANVLIDETKGTSDQPFNAITISVGFSILF